jgi:hypothetical protein
VGFVLKWHPDRVIVFHCQYHCTDVPYHFMQLIMSLNNTFQKHA